MRLPIYYTHIGGSVITQITDHNLIQTDIGGILLASLNFAQKDAVSIWDRKHEGKEFAYEASAYLRNRKNLERKSNREVQQFANNLMNHLETASDDEDLLHRAIKFYDLHEANLSQMTKDWFSRTSQYVVKRDDKGNIKFRVDLETTDEYKNRVKLLISYLETNCREPCIIALQEISPLQYFMEAFNACETSFVCHADLQMISDTRSKTILLSKGSLDITTGAPQTEIIELFSNRIEEGKNTVYHVKINDDLYTIYNIHAIYRLVNSNPEDFWLKLNNIFKTTPKLIIMGDFNILSEPSDESTAYFKFIGERTPEKDYGLTDSSEWTFDFILWSAI